MWNRESVARRVASISIHARKHWFFDAVQLAAIGCFLYWFRYLPAPGYAVAVLGVLAAVMSLHLDVMHTWQKAIWMVLIGGFLLLELLAIHKDRSDFAESEAKKRTEQLSEFNTIVREFKSVTEQNQTQFQSTMAAIQTTVNTSTGGDSFCYMVFPKNSISLGHGVPTFVGSGKYPLSSIDIRIVDLNKFVQKTADGHTLSLQEFLAGDVKIRIDELAPSSSAINLSWDIPFTSNDNQYFRIFYGARNGFWNEDLELRRIKGEWFEALKVWKNLGKTPKTIFSKIDPGFPLNERGKVDWPK